MLRRIKSGVKPTISGLMYHVRKITALAAPNMMRSRIKDLSSLLCGLETCEILNFGEENVWLYVGVNELKCQVYPQVNKIEHMCIDLLYIQMF
ncbi:hypothetical protein [Pontibacter burrus]|uniref:Uncharacterized protein n=1 Tax=Pontibacter burrus TaxID=2704466 RepID=A0A6B3LLZ9_9BACT|nr:hypothetical protein [Pontibacter burrus]NEM97759.1 hypothetical protein [Pontibacter burrus]